MYISRLALSDFRNYRGADIEIPSEGAVFLGPNGAGKTNLLEAVHLLCTGRSQRDADRRDMINGGADACCVSGTFVRADGLPPTVASIGFGRDRKVSMMRDGVRVASLSAWFGHGLAVSFGPDDLGLVSGPPSGRRRFLDILASQLCPGYLEWLIAYRRALMNRNRLLTAGLIDEQIDIYEDTMALWGGPIVCKRREIVAALQPFLAGFYAEISGGREKASVEFQPSFQADFASENDWKNVFSQIVKESRKKDMKFGFSSAGPHRDDVKLTLNSQPARVYGSQGQCRSLALALRLGSILCAEQYRHEKMIFLVDDAFSELDDERIARTYPLLEGRGQVLLATPGRVRFGGGMVRFSVSEGSVVRG